MLQSWNKLCFTTGYLEVNVSLPGAHNTPGFWPGTCSHIYNSCPTLSNMSHLRRYLDNG